MKHIPYVLLIEKEDAFIQLVRESLGKISPQYQLGVSKEKRRAFSCLMNESCAPGKALPDLILLNLDMPKEAGWQCLKKIKSHAGIRQIPLLGFTVHLEKHLLYRAYSLQANSCISHNIDTPGMCTLLNYWLYLNALPGFPSYKNADMERSGLPQDFPHPA